MPIMKGFAAVIGVSVEGSKAEGRQRGRNGWWQQRRGPKCVGGQVERPNSDGTHHKGQWSSWNHRANERILGQGGDDGWVRRVGYKARVAVPVERGMVFPVGDGAEPLAVLMVG